MLILGINGSPNSNGNTRFLLDHALDVAADEGAETKLIQPAAALEELDEPFCTVCSQPCTQQCYAGTALEEQFELLDQADGILMGSPVYFGSVSGQLKAFWDLARACRSEQYLLDTVGGCLTVGASRFGGQETTLQTMRNMMLVQGMTIVGDGDSTTDAGHYGAASQQDAAEDEQAHQRAEILSRRVCKVAEATQSLR